MSEEATRLESCRVALAKRGVKYVKFFLGAVSEKPATKVVSDAASFLEAVLAGKYKDSAPIGDGGGLKPKT